ncbi:MAG TPA: hypothetical protein VG276_21765 [Actinomycetes bacterium]|nr:hypothetical protein [Actinomycetes bacterium]
MSITAQKHRDRSRDASIRTVPLAADRGVAGQFRVVLVRYMVAAAVLLAVVIVIHPSRDAGSAPGGAPWSYQHELVDIAGGGVLNSWARAAVRATGWLARSSIERQRDVYRFNLFDFLVGGRTADGVGGWREGHRPLLEGGTQLVLLALLGYGILRRPSARTWLLAIMLVLGATLLVTKPQGAMRLAAKPGVGIPNVMLGAVAQVAPNGETRGARSADEAHQRLATRYWTSFVAQPLSRLQTGTSVLAEADPSSKGGVLGVLRRNVSGVNDWAIGRRGPERAFIATSALGYVLPFAVALGVLAMLATCAQTLLFLLCLAAPFAVPLTVDGPRRRGAVIRWWLLPLLASALVLAFASLASLAVMRVANALHSSDEYVGMLLAGSTWPLLFAVLSRWWIVRRRRLRKAAYVNATGE